MRTRRCLCKKCQLLKWSATWWSSIVSNGKTFLYLIFKSGQSWGFCPYTPFHGTVPVPLLLACAVWLTCLFLLLCLTFTSCVWWLLYRCSIFLKLKQAQSCTLEVCNLPIFPFFLVTGSPLTVLLVVLVCIFTTVWYVGLPLSRSTALWLYVGYPTVELGPFPPCGCVVAAMSQQRQLAWTNRLLHRFGFLLFLFSEFCFGLSWRHLFHPHAL